MADSDKFSIEINVNADKATKALDNLDKRAKTTQKTLEKPIQIPGMTDTEAVDNIRKFDKELKNVDDTFQELGASTDTVNKKTKSAFSITSILAFTTAITATAYAIKKTIEGISSISTSIMGITQSARVLGMTPTSLNAWGNAFKRIGLDKGAAQQSLSTIQDMIDSQLRFPDVKTSAVLGHLGVKSLRDKSGQAKSAEEVLQEMLSGTKNMSAGDIRAYGKMGGIDPNVLMTIASRPDFQKILQDEKTHTITKDQETAAEKLINAEANLASKFQDLTFKLVPVIDALSKLLDLINSVSSNPIANPQSYTATKGVGFVQNLKNTAKKAMTSIFGSADVNIKSETPEIESAIAMAESSNKNIGFHKGGMAIGKYGIIPGYAKEAFKKANMPQSGYSKQQMIDYLMTPSGNQTAHSLMFYQDLKEQKGSLRGALQEYSGGSYSPEVLNKILNSYKPPTAAESSAVTNSVSSNTKNTTISNNMNINGPVNVSANNPVEFGNAVRNQNKYLNYATNSYGQLA
jgi:hypothetical protein